MPDPIAFMVMPFSRKATGRTEKEVPAEIDFDALVGVRHAAMRQGCVLVAAEWALPVFDLDQMRQLRFPLPDGDKEIQADLQAVLEQLEDLL